MANPYKTPRRAALDAAQAYRRLAAARARIAALDSAARSAAETARAAVAALMEATRTAEG